MNGSSSFAPVVSVIMANYRGAAHLPAALESVLYQTVDNIELIVSDDASPDESAAVVRRIMARDPRVRLIATDRNGGPAAARNRALEAARGAWIAIVDSDDIVHPQRLEILLAAARKLDADAVADDLLFFSDSGRGIERTLLGAVAGLEPFLVSPEYFIRCNTAGSTLPPLGYVKPLLRREAIAEARYDESVRIGEDYDFLLRFLLGGGRLFVIPEALYLYRRHSGSISHRLSEKDVLAMIDSQEVFVRDRPLSPDIAALLEKRMRALRRAAAFERLVRMIKQRRLADAAGQITADPRLLAPLARSVAEHLQGRLAGSSIQAQEHRRLVLHDRNAVPPADHPVHAAAGIGSNAEMIAVPPYASPGNSNRGGGDSRTFRMRLARMGTRPDIQVIAHGLAGLFAMFFLPRTTSAWVVVDDKTELGRILDWTALMPACVLVADHILQDATSERLVVKRFCPGYHQVATNEGSDGFAVRPLAEG